MAPRWRARRGVLVDALRAEQPDVVALQECAWRLRPQSSQVASALGMRAGRAGTLGIVAREPFVVERRPWPARARGGSKRLLMASFGSTHVWVVHMQLDAAVRRACAVSMLEWASALPGDASVIVCGDFNEPPDGSAVTLLRDNGFVDAWTGPGPGHTWPVPAVRTRIDFVLARGSIVPARARLLEAPASDHRGVLAEFA